MKTTTRRALVLLTALILAAGCVAREKSNDRPRQAPAGGRAIGKVVRVLQHFLIENGGTDRVPSP